MNTIFLREFVTLAEVRNYWKAAERLYMNQSTLSKHIKTLEQELGIPLFSRTTRRIELTEYGNALLPYAQSMLRDEREYTTLLAQMRNQEQGLLVVGSIPVMAQYGILSLVADFQKRHPKNNIHVIEEDPQNLLRLLREKKCELIFQRESRLDFEKQFLEDKELCRIPYVRDRLMAVLPAGHPLIGRESLTLRDLQKERFCLMKEGTLMHNLCVEACHSAGFVPQIAFTSHRIESIMNMVCFGNCVGLLMDYHLVLPQETYGSRLGTRQEETASREACAAPKQEAAWTAVPVLPEIYTQISLCYLAQHPLSAAASNFVRILQEKIFSREEN